jgi:hypothetical protein
VLIAERNRRAAARRLVGRFTRCIGFLCIGFLNDLFYNRRYIEGPGEVSIAFPLDEKRDVVPGGSGWGARKVH